MGMIGMLLYSVDEKPKKKKKKSDIFWEIYKIRFYLIIFEIIVKLVIDAKSYVEWNQITPAIMNDRKNQLKFNFFNCVKVMRFI